MTDETPKPKRKGRRWIIAGVLLFVASVTVWWNLPRGDARLVGRWNLHLDANQQPNSVVVLKPNGVGEICQQDGRPVVRFYWRVADSKLTFGSDVPQIFGRVRDFLFLMMSYATGVRHMHMNESFRILHVGDDTIRLQMDHPSVTNEAAMRRIPE